MQVIKEASHYSMKMVVECDLSYNGRNETENKLSSDMLIRWLLVHYFKIELEFEKLFLVDGKKAANPQEKKNRRGIGEISINYKLDPNATPNLRTETRKQRWR